MRLLDVDSRQLQEYIGDEIPPYAILSHTWGDDEVLFQDLPNPDHRSKLGYAKIEGCCQQAIKDGHRYVWIDTCCIDKSSSAELSEAINSMYKWYMESEVCYVYLADVSPGDCCDQSDSEFRRSRWFTRGWTLQELLAPKYHLFFNREWKAIYHLVVKPDELSTPPQCPRIRSMLLGDVTGIPRDALMQFPRMTNYCAAAVLAWASNRTTSRIEDSAYSLLGLLDVNLPLLYGEGSKAFRRLQEEILKSRHDESILAAGYNCPGDNSSYDCPVFSTSISSFRHCGQFRKTARHRDDLLVDPAVHSTMTNIGLLIELPLIKVNEALILAVLRYRPSCEYPEPLMYLNDQILVVPLTPAQSGVRNHFNRAPGSTPFLLQAKEHIKTKRRIQIKVDSVEFLKLRMRAPRSQVYLQNLRDPRHFGYLPTIPNHMVFGYRVINVWYGTLTEEKYALKSFYPPPKSQWRSSSAEWVVDWKRSRIFLVFSSDTNSFLITIQVPRVILRHKPATATIRNINSQQKQALGLAMDESPALRFGRQLPHNSRNEIEVDDLLDDPSIGTTEVHQQINVSIEPDRFRDVHITVVRLWMAKEGKFE